MRRMLVRCCCLAVLVAPLTGAASQETYDTPRLPRSVYEAVVIPNDDPAPPQQPRQQGPPDSASNDADGPPPQTSCEGIGCPPTQVEVANQLLSHGPSTTEIYATFENAAHQFAVVGFVKQGWPLSVEYAAEPGTVTVLRIRLYHQRKVLIFPVPFYEVAFQANLDALPAESEGASPWHRTVTVDAVTLSRAADPIAGPGLHVARYDIRSYRLIDGQIDRRDRRPVEVRGITVGPDVVGSLSLLDAGFARGTIPLPAPGEQPLSLEFRYRTDRVYDLLHESIEHYDDAAFGYRFDRQVSAPHGAGQAQSFTRVWQTRRNQRPGTYRALIKGWWNCRGTMFAQTIESCPDSPNWAIATSRAIKLTQ